MFFTAKNSVLKRFVSAAALVAALACPGLAVAEDVTTFGEEVDIVARLDARIKVNKVFMAAAEKAVAESKSQDAESFLNKARILAEESAYHYKKSDWAFASEDITESTRMALYAIALATSKDKVFRDAVIQEEFGMTEGQDHARKEGMLTKSYIEAETFIMTADRLLAENENSVARQKLDAARKLLGQSRNAIAINDYDGALRFINDAYLQATQSVRDIKKAQGDAITYPKTEFASDRDAMIYEARRNDTYIFFASQVLKEDNEVTQKLLDDAQGLKIQATTARDKEDFKTAADKFKESTALLIKAIKEAVNSQ